MNLTGDVKSVLISSGIWMINCKGETMNKSELVDAIASGAGLTKAVASTVLEAFTSTVTDALKSGDQVVIPGFGSFSTGNRSARTGRNPQTGKTIQIKASRVAKFKAGKNLKEAVQEA
jgi:DNA-binding protein HU-beta